MDFLRRHKLITATIVIQIIALPLILLLVKQQQETRTQAQASSNLYFTPSSSDNSPIQTKVGESVALDVMLDPGQNYISFAKIEINYDSSLLQPNPTNPVVINSDAFPVKVEGPIVTDGKIQIVVSVGSSQEKVIQQVTKVLTLNMNAIDSSDQNTNITINTSGSQLLSTAPQDTATENVLATATPAVLNIAPAVIPDTTPPTILNPRALFITETSAQIQWETDEVATGQTQYGITSSYGSQTPEACCGQAFVQGLTGLTPDTVYHFRVISKDEAGNTATSSDLTFKTLTPPDTTPPTLFNPRVINITQTSATIVWETDEPADGQAVYGATTSYGGTTPSTPCCSQTFSHDITGLTPDTVYHFRVSSTDEAGNTATSSDDTFSTLPEITTTFNINGLKLHGLGSGGDNPNPTSWGTLNPLRPTRELTVQLFDSVGALVEEASGSIEYTGPTTGVFNGSVAFPDTVENGNYTIKLKSPYYLTGQVPGYLSLVKGNTYDITPIALVAGDVNLSNNLSVDDYDLIMACYSDLEAPKDCDDTKKTAADISDDGLVNQDDYNLFLRELSVQSGD